jgi:hypothetical protein
MTEANAGSRRRGRPPRSLAAKPVVSEDSAGESVAVAIERPAMRPPMREEDPRAAAARRAAEIRGHLGSMDEGTDEFFIDPSQIPDGWTYEWKRKTVLGQEDPAYQVHLARTGWEPVPTTKHPEMMPGQGNHPNIERKGMMLMMRPAVISEEARDIELRRARGQVKAKEEQLAGAPEGGLGHRDHAQVKPKIGKSYEAMPIPKD